MSLGAILSGTGKFITFHNLKVDKQKTFFLVTMGVGAKLEASFEAGSLLKELADFGAEAKRNFDVIGGVPLVVSEANDLSVYNPFSIEDLYGAFSYGISTGVDAGIVTTAVQGMSFRSSMSLTPLFNISGVQIEAVLGVGLNIYTVEGGTLYGIRPGLEERMRQYPQQQMRNMKRFGMRPHPGKM